MRARKIYNKKDGVPWCCAASRCCLQPPQTCRLVARTAPRPPLLPVVPDTRRTPFERSQSRICVSRDTDSARLPVGCTASALTVPLWPFMALMWRHSASCVPPDADRPRNAACTTLLCLRQRAMRLCGNGCERVLHVAKWLCRLRCVATSMPARVWTETAQAQQLCRRSLRLRGSGWAAGCPLASQTPGTARRHRQG